MSVVNFPLTDSTRREALWAKIMSRVAVHPNGCLEWTGPDSGGGRGGGYGRMNVDGGTMAVHIVAWVLRHGPIPRKKQLDHNGPDGNGCVSRRCINPDHLVLVTHKRNQKLRAKRSKLACVEIREAA